MENVDLDVPNPFRVRWASFVMGSARSGAIGNSAAFTSLANIPSLSIVAGFTLAEPETHPSMKTTLSKKGAGILAIAIALCATGIGRAQIIVSPPNYTVTTPGNEFDVQW